jgi:Co/Zn/Cd efflux system component
VALIAFVVAFSAFARVLQLGRDPVAVIALTGTAVNIAGIIVFGDPLHDDAMAPPLSRWRW